MNEKRKKAAERNGERQQTEKAEFRFCYLFICLFDRQDLFA